MAWTHELTADGLKFIGGAMGIGPFVAGRELWVYERGRWVTATGPGPGWNVVRATSPTEAWAVGVGGKVAQLTPEGWRLEAFDTRAYGVDIAFWGDRAWIPATHDKIYRRQDGAWSLWTPPELAERHTGVLWGAAPDDVWVHTQPRATGKAPDLGHWDGQEWTFASLSKPGYISLMHGTASDDVWAVGWTVKWIGKGPLAAHWDGRSWTEVDVPTKKRLTAVQVDAAGTVWLAGDGGTLLKGDGRQFTAVETPGGHITGVYSLPDGPVWIVVDSNRVFRGLVP